ncbi:Predicted arabinose efflux permease, MFS family [Enhydrobacter aerosaccus]|uniref:Predicted arabinose efflux permease, MFS family n=1 Tax=Enhydrobacter aerosaccus TaxID=225324 RepID=A0A1T4TKP4_9HYPH|nr:MFS transporter [Enhydrobacter aerosaccus]SKA40944.1 Predicted arabinose efflux permease, MFS family [Enhydrobacter aerosaccus]
MSRRYHGWWVVLCAFVIALYGWGFGFYGLSLYLVALHNAHGWSPGTISTAITFYYVVGAFLVMQVGDAIHRFGARPIVLGGIALMASGVAALGILREPWQLYLAILLMIPGWAAMGGGSINTLVAQWFDRRRGMAASLALSGATCGGLLFAPAFAWAIASWGFATACYAAIAVMMVTLGPFAAIVLRRRHTDEHDVGDDALAATSSSDTPRSRRQLLGEPRYLTMVGAFSIGLLAQISFIAHQAAFLEPSLGLKGAGWAVSLTALSALLGRIVVGMIVDKVDRRACSSAVLGIQIAGMVVLLSTSSVVGLYAGCALFGFGVGNLITLPGLIVQQEFPRRDFARAVSFNVAITQLLAAVGPSLLGLLHDLSGSYRSSLWACLFLQLAAAILVLIRPGPSPIDAENAGIRAYDPRASSARTA